MVTEFMSLLSVLLSCTNKPVQNGVVYQNNANSVSDSSSFTYLGGSNLSKVLECESGYVYDKIDIYKHPYTESSDLYLLKVVSQFTPGIVAFQNNTKMSDGKPFKQDYLAKGFVHISAYQYQRTEYGGDIAYKAVAPLSSLTTTTFSSSYGTTSTNSFSTNVGVSMDEMGNLKVSSSASSSTSLSLSYSSSVSSVSADPILSTQYAYNSNTKKREAQWSFMVGNPDIAGAKTYWLTSYLLFEMSNTVSYWNRDVFDCYIHFGYTSQNYYMDSDEYGHNEKVWKEKQTCSSADGGTYFA